MQHKSRMLEWLLVGVRNGVISEAKAYKLFQERYAVKGFHAFLEMLHEV